MRSTSGRSEVENVLDLSFLVEGLSMVSRESEPIRDVMVVVFILSIS